jgi:hypothetical protein
VEGGGNAAQQVLLAGDADLLAHKSRHDGHVAARHGEQVFFAGRHDGVWEWHTKQRNKQFSAA